MTNYGVIFQLKLYFCFNNLCGIFIVNLFMIHWDRFFNFNYFKVLKKILWYALFLGKKILDDIISFGEYLLRNEEV